MALTWGILAQGTLPNSKGTLYTAAGAVGVTSISLTNIDGSTRTYNIYFKLSGGSSRHVGGKDVSITSKQGIEVCPESQAYRMGSGDLLEGDADTASVVEYTIFGVWNV